MEITLEKISEDNRAEYSNFEIKTDLGNFQSRYPSEGGYGYCRLVLYYLRE